MSRRRARGTQGLVVAFGVIVAAIAAAHVGRGVDAEIWDDALFFRRVAYNVLHHGVAGWNRVDGPVFMNTSQLYQAISTGLLALAPRHFNAATNLWAAACTFATFAFSRRRDLEGNALVFVGLQAPPILMAIATGMDTCTVFVTLAAFLRVAMGKPTRWQPHILAAMNALVYLARPDVALLSMTISIGLLSAPGPQRWRRVSTFCAVAAAMLLAIGVCFELYYGSALPLATFLKLRPLSIYDHEYLALDSANKLTNLRQIGLLLLPLVPFVASRLDRRNVVLVTAGLAFIGFHAATTTEIMGYHARFYAPALPVFVWAAARGASRVETPRRRRFVVFLACLAPASSLVAYLHGWIENTTSGSYLETTPLGVYLVYFVGVAMVGVLLSVREGAHAITVGSLALVAIGFWTVTMPWRAFSVSTDRTIYETSAARDADLVGLDTIRGCFEEPVQMTHSELGVPGVLLPESRIIDFTGLANPSVVNRRFDFERLCQDDRPEFVFRPHRSHRALNGQLSASRCLAANYTAVRLARASACPLFVRNDHVARFDACSHR